MVGLSQRLSSSLGHWMRVSRAGFARPIGAKPFEPAGPSDCRRRRHGTTELRKTPDAASRTVRSAPGRSEREGAAIVDLEWEGKGERTGCSIDRARAPQAWRMHTSRPTAPTRSADDERTAFPPGREAAFRRAHRFPSLRECSGAGMHTVPKRFAVDGIVSNAMAPGQRAPLGSRHPMPAPPLRLGVNVDHVATLRNARGGIHPDPVRAANMAVLAGADGITAHLREDRRHIRDEDMSASSRSSSCRSTSRWRPPPR